MAKPGRNDRCPCGSGKKYKACCLTADEAAERETLAKAQSARDERAALHQQELRQVRETLMAKLAGLDEEVDDGEALTVASNAVIDMVKAGRLDEAEAAARSLLEHYPEVHDGWCRLGMVHEARGQMREAADCYRKVVEFARANPGYSDAEFEQSYAERAARLDPEPVG